MCPLFGDIFGYRRVNLKQKEENWEKNGWSDQQKYRQYISTLGAQQYYIS